MYLNTFILVFFFTYEKIVQQCSDSSSPVIVKTDSEPGEEGIVYNNNIYYFLFEFWSYSFLNKVLFMCHHFFRVKIILQFVYTK